MGNVNKDAVYITVKNTSGSFIDPHTALTVDLGTSIDGTIPSLGDTNIVVVSDTLQDDEVGKGAISGMVSGLLGGVVAAGDLLMVQTQGKFQVATAYTNVVAVAYGAGSGNDVIPIKLI